MYSSMRLRSHFHIFLSDGLVLLWLNFSIKSLNLCKKLLTFVCFSRSFNIVSKISSLCTTLNSSLRRLMICLSDNLGDNQRCSGDPHRFNVWSFAKSRRSAWNCWICPSLALSISLKFTSSVWSYRFSSVIYLILFWKSSFSDITLFIISKLRLSSEFSFSSNVFLFCKKSTAYLSLLGFDWSTDIF